MPRKISLTPAHVAQVPPYLGPPQPFELAGEVASEADHQALLAQLLQNAPQDLWIFAYGSLIWNPEFIPVEERKARLNGWHRRFCLGWIKIFRGCDDRPGLMLALDRGGSCVGVALRLAPETAKADLLCVLKREMPLRRRGYAPRWSRVATEAGPITALVFPIDRTSDAFVDGVEEPHLINSLSTAAGDHGTMAEYLLNTVSQLHARDIHDSYLWRLQKAVAETIETRALPCSPESPQTP